MKPQTCKIVLFCFFLTGSFFFAQNNPNVSRKLDSLVTVLKTAKQDTNKIFLLNKITNGFLITSDYQNAVSYAGQSLQLSTDLKFLRGKTSALGYLGNICEDQGQTSEAMNYYNQSLAVAKESNELRAIASAFNNLGNLFRLLGNYPEALKNYIFSLKIKEKLKDKKVLANAYSNIGMVYKNLQNYDEALKNYETALELRKKINDQQGISLTIGNIAVIQTTQATDFRLANDTVKANQYYKEALKNFYSMLKLAEEMNDQRSLAASYGNIGIVLDEQQKYAEAIKYELLALKINEACRNTHAIVEVCTNLGNINKKLKKMKEAKQYYLRALELIKETRSKESFYLVYLALADLENLQSDYKNAYEHYKLQILYRDSLFNEENTKKLVQSQMQYDFDKRSSADSIKNSEAKKFEEIKHQHEITKQKTFTYGGIAGFLVMIVVAGISYNAFRNKKKANVEIEKQKHIVEEKQKEILDSIYYARRIQRALITNEKYIERVLNKLNRRK